MSERSSKSFDCVQHMRKTRDRVSAQIAGKSYDEIVRWIRHRRFEDPVLQRLADKAAQGPDAAQRPSTAR